ncbi:MAG: sugar kinase [Chloroflexi bacterium]|nr:sugar kinase [Chloroflexota bacterium]
MAAPVGYLAGAAQSREVVVSRSVSPQAGRPEWPRGCFVGLGVLDLVHLVDRLPGPDEKVVSRDELVAAGGPAANAAVAFAWAGGRVTLVTALGRHPLGRAAAADLRACGVGLEDRAPWRADPPPAATILVTASTGERAVVSSTDRAFASAPPDRLAPVEIERLLDGAGVVLADGHHAALAVPLLATAHGRGIVTVLDAGTWRPAFEELIGLADVVIAGAAFRPPEVGEGAGAEAIVAALLARGAAAAARTAGPDPVLWRHREGGAGAIAVEGGPVVDTLGAGDVFHGIAAFLLAGSSRPSAERFEAALAEAARIATISCASFGTRAWLATPVDRPARASEVRCSSASRVTRPAPG